MRIVKKTYCNEHLPGSQITTVIFPSCCYENIKTFYLNSLGSFPRFIGQNDQQIQITSSLAIDIDGILDNNIEDQEIDPGQDGADVNTREKCTRRKLSELLHNFWLEIDLNSKGAQRMITGRRLYDCERSEEKIFSQIVSSVQLRI